MIDERGGFIDAMFAEASGDGDAVSIYEARQGREMLAIGDRRGLALSVSTSAANHHEITLVQRSFSFYMLEAQLEGPIGDRRSERDGLGCGLDRTS